MWWLPKHSLVYIFENTSCFLSLNSFASVDDGTMNWVCKPLLHLLCVNLSLPLYHSLSFINFSDLTAWLAHSCFCIAYLQPLTPVSLHKAISFSKKFDVYTSHHVAVWPFKSLILWWCLVPLILMHDYSFWVVLFCALLFCTQPTHTYIQLCTLKFTWLNPFFVVYLMYIADYHRN